MTDLSELPADAQARIETVKFEAAEERRRAIDRARSQLTPSPEKDELGINFPKEARMGNFQIMLICAYSEYLASVFFPIVEELHKIKGDVLAIEELFLEIRDETYLEWVESGGHPGNRGLFNEMAVGAVKRDTRYKDQLRTMVDSHADGKLVVDTRVRSSAGGSNQKHEIPRSAHESDLWTKLDHKFVNLKLKTLTKRRRREFEEEIAQARREYIHNLNETFPSAWIEARLRYLDRLLEDRYRVICEVWQEQGYPLSPQFLREAFTKDLKPTIETLGEHFWEEFHRKFRTRRGEPDSDLILRFGRGRMNEAKQRLRDDWYSRTEREARDLEYAITRLARTAMGSDEHKIAPEAAVPQGDKQSSRSSFSGVRAKSNKTGPRQRDPNVARRRVLIRNIVAKNTRLGKGRPSNHEIGDMLDREGVPYPGDAYRTWKTALANAPVQVNKLIAADISRN